MQSHLTKSSAAPRVHKCPPSVNCSETGGRLNVRFADIRILPSNSVPFPAADHWRIVAFADHLTNCSKTTITGISTESRGDAGSRFLEWAPDTLVLCCQRRCPRSSPFAARGGHL